MKSSSSRSLKPPSERETVLEPHIGLSGFPFRGRAGMIGVGKRTAFSTTVSFDGRTNTNGRLHSRRVCPTYLAGGTRPGTRPLV